MILITGANGQLGHCFRSLATQHPGLSFVFAGSADLDIRNSKAVNAFFEHHKGIKWVINCAAYTAVDKAESDVQQAKKVNVQGAKQLAMACLSSGAKLIHISTDYVYHNGQNQPFKETDKVSPKSVYARTKLSGERAIQAILPVDSMIIRTSWVYAAHGQNFVRTMLRLGADRPSLNVVFDQIGTPTYAPDLAAAILAIIQKVANKQVEASAIAGIWHYSNEGVTSWYDFAQAIFDLKGLPCKVNPIESKDYPTPAQRPPFSVLNKAKIKMAFGLVIPHWRESLKQCLKEL